MTNYKNSKIKKIKAREIFDSGGKPTVEAELETDFGKFLASVPSGVSVGKYEALELRDGDGKGVKKAIENIEKIISPALENEDLGVVDKVLVKLDGTKDKSCLGANAILAISIAACRAGSAAEKIPLWRHIANLAENGSPPDLPKPSFNMIEGGKHASNGLAFQEFMVVPQDNSFKENFETGKKIYAKLKDVLGSKFTEVKLSAEGAFSAPRNNAREALNLILEASPGENIKIAIDAAASSFYLDGSYKIAGNIVSKEELAGIYRYLISHYPIISIEDPFFEEDFEGFAELKREIGNAITIFGDDLTASNIERIKLAQEKGACNGLILKPNQIGTVTETIEAAKLAKSYGWKIMVSNRAGETEDDFIADLAVGIGADFIKSGAPFPKERMAKYNRLVKIEEELYKN